MMKTLFFLIAFVLTIKCEAQVTDFGKVVQYTLKSDALGEDRKIWVGLPMKYDSTKTYSTIYVLDAEDRFDITYALSKEFFQNQNSLAELIVVGISNVDWKQRMKDMTFTDSKIDGSGDVDSMGYLSAENTGNGLKLLKHIEEEIVPYVNKNYATNGFNTLVGHSLGGYFCAYILPIQKSFSVFQIYDPSIWYNDGDVLKHLKRNLPKDFKSTVFISKGLHFDGPRKYIDFHLAMIDSLEGFLKTYPLVNTSSASYEKDHVGMYFNSVIDGLTQVFDECDYGFISQFDKITLDGYQNFYRAASVKYGYTFSPPVDGIRWVAYANYYQQNWEEAIKCYLVCYASFQNDLGVNEELKKCYEMLGDKTKAQIYEKKLLEMKQN